MPLTFIDIEKQKGWRIAALFCALLILYSLFALVIYCMGYYYLAFRAGHHEMFYTFTLPLTLKSASVILLVALAASSVHFLPPCTMQRTA